MIQSFNIKEICPIIAFTQPLGYELEKKQVLLVKCNTVGYFPKETEPSLPNYLPMARKWSID